MAKGNNQKLKLLYLAQIFQDRTDDSHGISIQEIISLLAQREISADRKTLYLDIEELRRFGLDIVTYKEGRNVLYSLASRDFDLPELKLLVDVVQSSKFITEKKSRNLIKKLESLCSNYEARELQRQVILTDRVKAFNESIFIAVDIIHQAINRDHQIQFKYFQWNVKKEQELRHDGQLYQISPWALLWDDENYYLLGYDSHDEKFKHYRVDKMLSLKSVDVPREGKELFDKLNLPKYTKSLFGMYGGEPTVVTLKCANHMAGPVIDRFGKDLVFTPIDSEHFRTNIQVSVSRQFLGWIVSLGPGIQILGPESVIDALRDEAKRLTSIYE